MELRNFNHSWDGRCAKAGVRKITVHDGRRTCATLLVDLDVHLRAVMQILRHAQIAVTMEIYAQASSQATTAALKRLGRAWMAEALLYFPAVLASWRSWSGYRKPVLTWSGTEGNRTPDLLDANEDRRIRISSRTYIESLVKQLSDSEHSRASSGEFLSIVHLRDRRRRHAARVPVLGQVLSGARGPGARGPGARGRCRACPASACRPARGRINQHRTNWLAARPVCAAARCAGRRGDLRC
ncbi:MAG: tyrosine-type recombinase/integrase [Pseudonocardiaceae bacterium]